MPEPTVVVGKVTKAHGLHGEVMVLVFSDNPDRFEPGSSMFLEDGREVRVRTARPNGGRLLVAFEGVGDRNAADAWGDFVKKRKRGRLDPCGSGVVTKLAWDTSGSEAAREGGLYRDFSVAFTMEIKKFPTQFAPGSTECVPK